MWTWSSISGAVVALPDENCVVEVARGLAVDGDDGQRSEVAAVGGFVAIEMSDGTCFGEHGLGKNARELVLADHHLHVDAEVVWQTENFNDSADRRMIKQRL